MHITSVREFHQIMTENNLVLVYEGEFNQQITKNVLSMAERNMDKDNLDSGVKKKVYNVMVESLQNICKHQYVEGLAYKTAIFIIGETGNDLMIISGNPILNENIDVVKTKIDLINSKDKDGLKELYKELRLNSTLSQVGGAGLGFVDMARKSENKLEYKFETLTENVSYFTLLSRISKEPSNS